MHFQANSSTDLVHTGHRGQDAGCRSGACSRSSGLWSPRDTGWPLSVRGQNDPCSRSPESICRAPSPLLRVRRCQLLLQAAGDQRENGPPALLVAAGASSAIMANKASPVGLCRATHRLSRRQHELAFNRQPPAQGAFSMRSVMPHR
jgi:hypothetical protein